MKNKKLLISIISIVFAIVVISLAVSVFTIKQVKVNYTVTQNVIDTNEINESANSFAGKNLLFLNTDKIVDKLEENPYVEVVSVEKKFPNVVEVSVKERKEIYTVEYEGKTYLTDVDGLVLAEKDATKVYGEHELISLSLKNVNVLEFQLGKVIKTDAQDFISNAFEIARQVNLTDSVKNMEVEKIFSGVDNVNASGYNSRISFETYSGVTIVIYKAEIKGLEKAVKAFELYDSQSSDYVKSFDNIVVLEVNGEIKAEWTSKNS